MDDKRRTLFIPLLVGLLLLGTLPNSVSADIIDNVYNYQISIEGSYQENTGPVFISLTTGQFQITVYNLTPSDYYEYNIQGYINYYINENTTVNFLDNKVFFELHTTDVDANNRSESTYMSYYPFQSSHMRYIFVNPVWSTHTSDWDNAVAQVENDSTVSSFSESTGDGLFSFDGTVNTESYNIDYGTLNGTISFSFDGGYDSDGVLNSMEYGTSSSVQNENYTGQQSMTYRITRVTTFGGLSADLSIPLLYVGVIGVVVLIVGVIIGKKMAF